MIHQWKSLDEYYSMRTPEFFFQKSSKFEFWLVTMSWNHLSFVNISPTIVIDTSMERSSRVLQHGHIKIGFFFKKKFGTEFRLVFCLTCFLFKFEIKLWLIFDFWQRSEVIHVGLNKHLYDDIGDASSSLPGSTSSYKVIHFYFLFALIKIVDYLKFWFGSDVSSQQRTFIIFRNTRMCPEKGELRPCSEIWIESRVVIHVPCQGIS